MSILWLQGHAPVPSITDERCQELSHIVPVVRNGPNLHWAQPADLDAAYTWTSHYNLVTDDLFEWVRIETYHRCGYVAFFKPSCREVYACIQTLPQDILSKACAFEILQGDTVACYSEGDGHRTVTILYGNDIFRFG